MKTFEIKSWILGIEQKIIVTEPIALDSNEFKLDLGERKTLLVKCDNGHWSFEPTNCLDLNNLPRQLEIDSIGFQIAKYWCFRLEKQLENFQLSL